MNHIQTPIVPFIIRPLPFIIAIFTACFLSLPVQAQTSVWTGTDGNGLWSDVNNWTGGVPNASGATADFSQYDLTADTVVHLDEPVTIGNMIIGNTDANPQYSWTFDDNSNKVNANILTLAPAATTSAGGGCAITVTNMGSGLADFTTLTIGGTNGLVVNGGGFLELDNPCPYTNETTIAGATLYLGTNTVCGEEKAGTNDIYTLGSSTATGPSILRQYMDGKNFSNPINCAPNAAGPLMIGEWNGNACNIIDAYINLNGDTLIITNGADNTTHNFVVEPSAGITNYGNVILINDSPSGDYFAFGTIALNNNLNNIGTVTLGGSTAQTVAKAYQVFFGPLVTNINIVGPCAIPAFTAPANANGDFTINSSSTGSIGAITLPAGLSNATFNANSTGPITVGTVNAGFQGNIVNSGSGPGPTIIAAITTGASNVTQSSATSPLILSAANTYPGGTTISAGTLILTNNASIADTTNISIAAGATLDVSALTASTFTLGSPAALSASGTGTTIGTSSSAIKGKSGGTVNLGSIPIILNFDGSDPALYIPQGTLSLNGNAFTVNSASPLGPNTYTIIQQAGGTITSNGTYSVSGTAIGAGATGMIQVVGTNVNLVVTSSSQPPPAVISSVVQSGGNLVLVWQGGTNQNCVLLISTNAALPMAQWTPVATNTVGSGGFSTNIIPINPGQPVQFFLLSIP